MIARRSALTMNKIEKGLIGYKSHLVEQALNLMVIDGHLQYDMSGKDVRYQLTLKGLSDYETAKGRA